jgi:hypothetical protein
VFSSWFMNGCCKLSNQLRGRIASLPPSSIAGEDGSLWKKADGTRGTDGKVIVIETTMPFLQDARPWEEGGKRRIAPATTVALSKLNKSSSPVSKNTLHDLS